MLCMDFLCRCYSVGGGTVKPDAVETRRRSELYLLIMIDRLGEKQKGIKLKPS